MVSPRFSSSEPAGQGEPRLARCRTSQRYGSIFLTVFSFAFETSVSDANCAFRPGPFLVRMWAAKAWWRRSFPVPVFLKRLAAPRWVLIFGIAWLLTG